MYNPFSLKEKIILVTGASSGIGRAIAIECTKMGAKVIISARNEERLNETFNLLEGEGHKIIISNLIQEDGIKKVIDNIPKLDGAVLSAGKAITLPIQFSTREKFDDIFNINFFSQAELTRLLFKKKILKKDASLVFIDSVGGLTSFNFGNGVYGSSKAALDSFMKYCSKEFAPRKIRVNCVCPGMIETPLIHRGTLTKEQHQEYMQKYPLKRFGTPEEVAYGVIYLLSDAASWVTGINLFIDGGGDN